MNRTLLATSMGLNGVLLVASTWLLIHKQPQPVPPSVAPPSAVAVAQPAPAPSAAVIESRGDACTTIKYEYWLPASIAEAKLRLARDELRSANCAVSELAARYPFLSPDKLRIIEQARLSADRQRVVADGAIASKDAELHVAVEDEIARALGPAERFEYAMRESVLAQQLLATTFPFTEAEFRAVFGVLHARAARNSTQRAGASQGFQLESDEVRSALSEPRYELLVRHQDPVYRTLRRLAAEQRLPQERIEGAYLVIRRCAEQMKAEGLSRGVIGHTGEQRIAQLAAARDAQLTELLGAGAAARLSSLLNTVAARNVVRLTTRN